MDIKPIFVTKQDYQAFKKGVSSSRISRFLKEIEEESPDYIKDLFASGYIDLVLQDEDEFDITGADSFQFKFNQESLEVNDYLDKYVVFVENNSPEVSKWREKMRALAHNHILKNQLLNSI